MQDLLVLAADKNMLFAVRGALSRPKSLGIRPITVDFRVHPGRDGGVRTTGPEIIAGETSRFRHAVVLLDFLGCGEENTDPLDIESKLDSRMEPLWKTRAKAFVISPEVDIWMWGSDNALAEILDWTEPHTIRQWLVMKGFEFSEDDKPCTPKEALEAIVAKLRLPRSSSLYEEITMKISLARCTDATFGRVRSQLRSWFPKS